MSWWDYGHMITYIAHRIPNANPFQQGVTGPNGSAAYFMATSEDTANAILDADGTRYVITDIDMDTGKFWAMATWYNSTAAGTPYQTNMFSTQASPTRVNTMPSRSTRSHTTETIVSRLHNFDGSMTPRHLLSTLNMRIRALPRPPPGADRCGGDECVRCSHEGGTV